MKVKSTHEERGNARDSGAGVVSFKDTSAKVLRQVGKFKLWVPITLWKWVLSCRRSLLLASVITNLQTQGTTKEI